MEAKRRVKLYKHGKVWLAAALFATGVGAATISVPMLGNVTQIVQAASVSLVTTKDASGTASVDPDSTGGGAVAITADNAADYFTAKSQVGNQRAIVGNTVQLTTGHETNSNDGVALLVANQQIDFKSDFSLNLTMNIAYDASMGNWVPGDGTALIFQPLDAATTFSTASAGQKLGITNDSSVASDQVVAFNISSNALHQLVDYPANQWVIFESNKASNVPLDTPVVPGNAIGPSGSLSYTYDMTYNATTRTLTTKVLDENGGLLKTWNFAVPSSWSDTGYTMAVSASTAASHGAYQAVLNNYAYTPASTTMSIQSSGLPSSVDDYNQTGIAAIAGNVVAFYPEGATAPTTDGNGQPVTAAYEVPAVDGYVLKNTQFLTVSTNPSDNVAVLNFAKQSTVNVKYVDTDGNEIKDAMMLNGLSGDAYSTTVPTIDGYTFTKFGDGSALLGGHYTDNPQTVTLVYTKNPVVAGDLTVNYVDQDGSALQPATTKSGNVGDAYSIDAPDIDGYTYAKLADGSAALSGKLTADAQSVTLVYTKNPVPAADVTVKYVDEAGRTLNTATILAGNIGDDYTVTPDDIAGYAYVGLGTDSAALTGPFSADAQTITLVYKPNTQDIEPVDAAPLTIKYVDEAGRTIQSDVVKNGSVGNGYEVTPDTIGGYTYVGLGAGSAALKGQLTATAQTITLVYKANTQDIEPVDAGALTIKYVDEAGRTISPDVVKNGSVGNGYEVTPNTIKGYSYVGLGDSSAALKGQLTTGAQTITLVYKLNTQDVEPVKAGDLTIKYVDENGKTLKTSVVKSGFVGNGYSVSPDAIKGYSYVGLGKDSAALKGQFSKAAQAITLVYKAAKLTPTTNTTGDSTGAKRQPAAKPVKRQLATKATKDSRSLPQTGERTNHTLSQLGLIGLLSLMIVGIMRLRRRA